MNHSRHSVYRDLQRDYQKNLSWAKALGVGTQSAHMGPVTSCDCLRLFDSYWVYEYK